MKILLKRMKISMIIQIQLRFHKLLNAITDGKEKVLSARLKRVKL